MDDFGLVKKPSRATYGARFMVTKGGSGSRRILYPKRSFDNDEDSIYYDSRNLRSPYQFNEYVKL